MKLGSYASDRWVTANGGFIEVRSAVDGHVVALASSEGLDVGAMVAYARTTGGPNLRARTFRERADMLRALAGYLNERKGVLHELSFDTGATRGDAFFDVDGGIGTLFAYASRGRRELPAEHFVLDGALEPLSKRGTFVARHLLVPLEGVAVHINAFNFPCWGMLEKLAPAILAGVPVITKPATATANVAQATFRMIVESGILAAGRRADDPSAACTTCSIIWAARTSSRLTGLLTTSLGLRESIPRHRRTRGAFHCRARFAERGGAGAGCRPGHAGVRTVRKRSGARDDGEGGAEVHRDPSRHRARRAASEAAQEAIVERLREIVVGDPRREDVKMGALASQAQRDDVRARVADLATESSLAFGDPATVATLGASADDGAFLSPPCCASQCAGVGDEGATTWRRSARSPALIAYDGVAQAIELAKRGRGSLVASVYSYDDTVANELILGMASHHGRIIAIDRDCARESTSATVRRSRRWSMADPAAPAAAKSFQRPARRVRDYLQRTALQGSPSRIASLTHTWVRGAREIDAHVHPFTRTFEQLEIGETIHTAERTISIEDIEHFAAFTGDTFYAHMDEEAAKANPFFPGRVAHGYLILSFAAGLFVDPAPGPVLANYGLDALRFVKPVSPGDAIRVRLTVKQKTPRKPEYGEVRWDVEVTNREGEIVASYDLLTMNAIG